MTSKTRFKIKVLALLNTVAGPSPVVTATIKRARGEATFVFVDDRELAYLEALVVHECDATMLSVPWMEQDVSFRAVLRGHAIDAETGASPDDVDPFERATPRWPASEPAWLQVEAFARYFLGYLVDWRAKHGGQRAPTGFTFNAIRRLAIAAGHDPDDRDLDRLAETVDRLTDAHLAKHTARRP
jgi:hypothetical protein